VASNETGMGKNGRENADCRPINRYVSETIEHRHIHCVPKKPLLFSCITLEKVISLNENFRQNS